MRCLLPSLCVAHKFATLRLVAFLLPAFCSNVFLSFCFSVWDGFLVCVFGSINIDS